MFVKYNVIYLIVIYVMIVKHVAAVHKIMFYIKINVNK